MLLSEAETQVRLRTNQDLIGTDGAIQPVTSFAIISFLNKKYEGLHRRLAEACPTLYSRVKTFTVSSNSTNSFAFGSSPLSLTDFDRIRRMERLVGTRYVRMDPASPVQPDDDDILRPKYGGSGYTYLERGDSLEIYPRQNVKGSYRLTYVAAPDTLPVPGDEFLDTAIPLPPGLEDIIIEEVCAMVRSRFDDDPTPHLNNAASLEAKLIPPLRRRYGVGNSPGLV